MILPLGSVSVFGGNVTSAVIDDLVTDTEYAVSVAGLTIDEELEKVGPILVTTCKCPYSKEKNECGRTINSTTRTVKKQTEHG